jgi:branched-chain amino acid transport system substrate-binding protein
MDRQGADDRMLRDQPIARRSLLKGVGAGTLAVGAGGFLSACSSGIKGAGGPAKTGTITIGFITPLTGQLAGFASGDQYVLSQIRSSSAYQKGFKVGGKTYKVNIVVQDSQSDPNRASPWPGS